jgi:hypothetical protein
LSWQPENSRTVHASGWTVPSKRSQNRSLRPKCGNSVQIVAISWEAKYGNPLYGRAQLYAEAKFGDFCPNKNNSFKERVECIMQNEFRRERNHSNKKSNRLCGELIDLQSFARPAAEKASICDYIASMVTEFSALSEGMDEEILVYLLNLTAQEARSAMNRKRDGVQVSHCGMV